MSWLEVAKLLTYSGLAVLLGGVVVRRWRLSDAPLWWLGLGTGLIVLGAGLEVGSTLVDLGFTAPSDVADFLTSTRTGKSALVRIIGAAVLLAAALQHWRWLEWAGGLIVLYATSNAGHAGERGGIWLLLDMLHAGAAAIWVGGVLAFALGALRGRLLSPAVTRRFTPLALSCLAVLSVSGVITVLGYIPLASLWPALWGSTWGVTLLLKLGLIELALLSAVLVRLTVAARLSIRAPKWLPLCLEAALLLSVLGLSGALATSPPPSTALIQRQAVPISVKLGQQTLSGQLVLSGTGDAALTLTPALPKLSAALQMLDHPMPDQPLPLETKDNQLSGQTRLWMSGNWALKLEQGAETARVEFAY
ncbi:hypothetical protein EHF33_00660 [Deinococcus psychrotolerans]|uniref:Copper resistance protein D domain-containing protein n=1 Tax=Deinococcus psychrotolerans TaxID=2489213 RepID=A0A3G8YB71_9DEIO|nr:CopD family protein [Deinococcus psychrotolerans]AZI41447.1 hypothetical protein EHF33_00660 [Deinococcus psychrotolerans]